MSDSSVPLVTGSTASPSSSKRRYKMESSRFPASPSTPSTPSSRLPPLPSPRLPPLRSPRSSLRSFVSPRLSTAPWSPHPTPAPRTSSLPASSLSTSAPQQQQQSITLAPLLSDTPLPRPTDTTLPSIREVFPNFPPQLPPRPPPQNRIPDVSNLFALLVPRNKQQPPLSDNIGDDTVCVQVCAACGNPNPTMACPRCHLVHYCGSTTCLLQDTNHPSICTRYNNVAAAIYAKPHDHSTRLKLVEILESLFKRQRTRHLLQMAIWHRNEIIRLSRNNDRLRVHLEFPFNLLRTGENDAAVSFVRHWARKTLHRVLDTDRYVRSAPGDRTYPVNLDRYEDPLAENFPRGTVPLTHLITLCLVKIRLIISINVRMADKRQKAFWASNFGKRLSVVAGMRLEDFFHRGGRPRHMGEMQVQLLAKYLALVRERNPIMELVMREPRLLQNGPPNGWEASFGEAKEIWKAVGDLFMQLPGYPHCIY